MRLNELREWIEVNRWNSDKDIKVFVARSWMRLTCQPASMHVPAAHKDHNNTYRDFHFLTACIDF